MVNLSPLPAKDIETAKYYCTLALAKYERPDPFAAQQFVPTALFKLPLPLELRDETRVDYNNINMVAVGDILNTGGSVLKAEALRQSGKLASAAIGAIGKGVGGMVGGAMGGREGAATGTNVGGVISGIAQEALPADAIMTAIQQSMGKAPNPNPTVAFQGPVLREHTLTWTFMPASRDDARNVRNLINRLKRASLPGVGYSPSILQYPEICQVNFFPWDSKGGGKWGWGDNSIIKMKQCFMASVNVDYTSGSAPAFFHGDNNEPVVTRLTINFKEIEYFLGIDYGFDQQNYNDKYKIYEPDENGVVREKEVEYEEYLIYLERQGQAPPGDAPTDQPVDETDQAAET